MRVSWGKGGEDHKDLKALQKKYKKSDLPVGVLVQFLYHTLLL